MSRDGRQLSFIVQHKGGASRPITNRRAEDLLESKSAVIAHGRFALGPRDWLTPEESLAIDRQNQDEFHEHFDELAPGVFTPTPRQLEPRNIALVDLAEMIKIMYYEGMNVIGIWFVADAEQREKVFKFFASKSIGTRSEPVSKRPTLFGIHVYTLNRDDAKRPGLPAFCANPGTYLMFDDESWVQWIIP